MKEIKYLDFRFMEGINAWATIPYTIKSIADFPWHEIEDIGECKHKPRRRKKGHRYIDCIGTFDTENTKLPGLEQASNWSDCTHLTFYNKDGELCEYTILTATLEYVEGCVEFLDELAKHIKPGYELCMFTHNLGYDMVYISGLIPMTDKHGLCDLKAKDKHHPMSFHSHGGKIFWRDSAMLFGCKLEEATEGLPHAKIDGKDFDYSKKRFSNGEYVTPISPLEFSYIDNDTYGLSEAIRRLMKDNGDDLYSLPNTLTGFVRRDVSKIMFKYKKFGTYAMDSFEDYEILDKAFKGGISHGNRYNSGSPIYRADPDGGVKFYDGSSMYPNCMIHDRYPLTPFVKDNNKTLEHLHELTKDGWAYVIEVRMRDVCLKDLEEPLPFQSVSHCYGVIGPTIEDNGRLMATAQCHACFTDVDFGIFMRYYNADIEILDLRISKYGFLPFELRSYIIQLYKDKCKLKKNKALDPDGSKMRVIKSRINSIYGLCVQRAHSVAEQVVYDPTKNKIDSAFPGKEFTRAQKEADYEAEFEKRYLPFRWGVWVCSWSKYHIMNFYDMVNNCDDAIWEYMDTDSCEFSGTVPEEELNKFNEYYIRRAKISGAYETDVNGETHYCGAFESDPPADFVQMGAKKYATVRFDKKLQRDALEITIAGVPKSEGSKELEEFGGLEAFKPGTIFNAGKLRPIVNNERDYGYYCFEDYTGHVVNNIHVTSNVCLVDTSYKLNYGKEYKKIVDDPDGWIDEIPDIMAKYQYYVDRYRIQ